MGFGVCIPAARRTKGLRLAGVFSFVVLAVLLGQTAARRKISAVPDVSGVSIDKSLLPGLTLFPQQLLAPLPQGRAQKADGRTMVLSRLMTPYKSMSPRVLKLGVGCRERRMGKPISELQAWGQFFDGQGASLTILADKTEAQCLEDALDIVVSRTEFRTVDIDSDISVAVAGAISPTMLKLAAKLHGPFDIIVEESTLMEGSRRGTLASFLMDKSILAPKGLLVFSQVSYNPTTQSSRNGTLLSAALHAAFDWTMRSPYANRDIPARKSELAELITKRAEWIGCGIGSVCAMRLRPQGTSARSRKEEVAQFFTQFALLPYQNLPQLKVARANDACYFEDSSKATEDAITLAGWYPDASGIYLINDTTCSHDATVPHPTKSLPSKASLNPPPDLLNERRSLKLVFDASGATIRAKARNTGVYASSIHPYAHFAIVHNFLRTQMLGMDTLQGPHGGTPMFMACCILEDGLSPCYALR